VVGRGVIHAGTCGPAGERLAFGEAADTVDAAAVLDVAESHTASKVRHEAVNRIADAGANGTGPAKLGFEIANCEVAVEYVDILGDVIIGHVTVDTENDVVAEVEVITGINATEETIRLDIAIAEHIAVEVRLAPAVADLATNIGAGPGEGRSNHNRSWFLFDDGVGSLCARSGHKGDSRCKKKGLELHDKPPEGKSQNQYLSPI